MSKTIVSHIKWASFMVCELYLNRDFYKDKQEGEGMLKWLPVGPSSLCFWFHRELGEVHLP